MDTVQIYDPTQDRWRTGPPLPRPLDHAAVTTDGHRIYVIGGQTDDDGKKVVQAEVWMLDLDEAEQGWEPLAPLPGHARPGPPRGTANASSSPAVLRRDQRRRLVGGMGTRRISTDLYWVNWRRAQSAAAAPRGRLGWHGHVWFLGGKGSGEICRIGGHRHGTIR